MSRQSASGANVKPRICIISFSPISRDGRVLRQIEYLAPHYDLTVIGYGDSALDWPTLNWRPVRTRSNRFTQVSGLLLLVLGRIMPRFYELWYWQKPHHKAALQYAVESNTAAYHANDWNALPVAAEAARRVGARLVFDAHEYAPLEYENRRSWRLLYKPLTEYFLRRYARQINASSTVAKPIAERYAAEFGFHPIVILNAPKLAPVPSIETDPAAIRLVHHGGANRDRKIELMIRALALADQRYSLHLILIGGEPAYLRELRNLAKELAPDRIHFHEPVAPGEIVRRIAPYDIGFFLLEPNNYNYSVALPNKLFEFLAAGLAILIGPSPGMAALADQYGFGMVAPSFRPEDVATILNKLTVTSIESMKWASRRAALEFTADREMGKLLDLYNRLLMSDGARQE